MSLILISGAVGSGKTSFAKELAKEINYNVLHLNELAKEYEIENVESLQTFDFDLDELLDNLEKNIREGKYKNTIFESHFSHFINPELVDILFIINRDLKDLKKEYENRGYNDQKIADNLEVESFNLCYYEAEEEGFSIVDKEGDSDEARVFCFDNDQDLNDLVRKALKKLNKLNLL